MLDLLLNGFWLVFVSVTGLLLILLAICGVLIAGWSARDYFRTRRAEPVDWYDITLPEAPRRATDRKRFSHTAGQPVPTAGETIGETYLQEEFPF